MTTPDQPNAPQPQWHKITPDNPPQFPCWLWHSPTQASVRSKEYFTREYPRGMTITHYGYTHWHPDQPEAPTSRPDEQDMTLGSIAHPVTTPPATQATPPQWCVDAAEEIGLNTSCRVSEEERIAAIIARHEAKELADLRAAWAEREPHLYAAEREVESQREKYSAAYFHWRDQFAVMEKRHNDAHELAARLRCENDDLRAQLAAMTKERDGLCDQLGRAAEEYRNINHAHHQLSELYEADRDAARSLVVSLRAELSAAVDARIGLANDNLRLIAQLEKLEQERDGLIKQNKMDTVRFKEMQDAGTRLEIERDELVRFDEVGMARSDIALVNHPKASSGTDIGIQYMYSLHRHIVLVCPDERPSPWLVSRANKIFKTMEEALVYLETQP